MFLDISVAAQSLCWFLSTLVLYAKATFRETSKQKFAANDQFIVNLGLSNTIFVCWYIFRFYLKRHFTKTLNEICKHIFMNFSGKNSQVLMSNPQHSVVLSAGGVVTDQNQITYSVAQPQQPKTVTLTLGKFCYMSNLSSVTKQNLVTKRAFEAKSI